MYPLRVVQKWVCSFEKNFFTPPLCRGNHTSCLCGLDRLNEQLYNVICWRRQAVKWFKDILYQSDKTGSFIEHSERTVLLAVVMFKGIRCRWLDGFRARCSSLHSLTGVFLHGGIFVTPLKGKSPAPNWWNSNLNPLWVCLRIINCWRRQWNIFHYIFFTHYPALTVHSPIMLPHPTKSHSEPQKNPDYCSSAKQKQTEAPEKGQ